VEVFGSQQALGTHGVDIPTNWISESTMHYDRSLLDHSFSGMTGFTAQRNMSRSNSVSSNNYPNNLIQTLNSAIITGGSSSMSVVGVYRSLQVEYTTCGSMGIFAAMTPGRSGGRVQFTHAEPHPGLRELAG
jgi:hypothetical protein